MIFQMTKEWNMRGLDYLDRTSNIVNCNLEPSVQVYKYCSLRDCCLSSGTEIGDYSRLRNSNLGEMVFVQRYNIIENSEIGRFSYTGKNTIITSAVIGKFCSISWNVSLGAGNHDYNRTTTHAFLYDDRYNLKPKNISVYDLCSDHCIIGNDVWIASGACVCRGVTIGDGAVIAAGSVVTKDVDPYTIVGGVPAKQIKKRFDENTIKRMKSIPWWDLLVDVISKHFRLFECVPSKDSLDELEMLCNIYLEK